jgi:hypothetical protein
MPSGFRKNDLLVRDDVNKFDLRSNSSFFFSPWQKKMENRFPNEFELFFFSLLVFIVLISHSRKQ